VPMGILTKTVGLSESIQLGWILALASFPVRRPGHWQVLLRAPGWKILKPQRAVGPMPMLALSLPNVVEAGCSAKSLSPSGLATLASSKANFRCYLLRHFEQTEILQLTVTLKNVNKTIF